MESGRFGPPIGSSASGDDRFGYFGGSPTPGSAMGQPAPSQFGGPGPSAANPTHGAPQSPFGGPAPIAASSSGALAPVAPRRRTWLSLILAAVLVAALAGGGWWWLHRDAIVLPDHLGALALNSDVQAATGQLDVQTKSGNVTSRLAAYGTPALTGLVVSRGAGVSSGLNAVPLTQAGLEHYGPVTCDSHSGFILCLRAEGDLAVVVQTSTSVATESQTADFVQQAWNAQ